MAALNSIELKLLGKTDYVKHGECDRTLDSAYRRRHLAIAGGWILGDGEPTDQEREDFEDLEKNWHNWEEMQKSCESEEQESLFEWGGPEYRARFRQPIKKASLESPQYV